MEKLIENNKSIYMPNKVNPLSALALGLFPLQGRTNTKRNRLSQRQPVSFFGV